MKAKEYVKKHKHEIGQEILKLGYYGMGVTIGYVVGSKITGLKIEIGLQNMFKQNPNIEPLMKEALEALKKS